jgi:hypothetical protein
MNDDDLLTAVRESFAGVHSGTPVERIVTRGRAVRARRWIPSLAGALAVVAAVVLTVTALLPGHHPSGPHGVQLAAWTVVKHADGTVRIYFREVRDPARLQRTLRRDGVPATVLSIIPGHNPPYPCQPYGHPRLEHRVITEATMPEPARYPVFAIHPSALPKGAAVQIWFKFWTNGSAVVGAGLVVASQGCIGS